MKILSWWADQKDEWKRLREQALREQVEYRLEFTTCTGIPIFAPVSYVESAKVKILTDFETDKPKIQLPKDYK